MRASSFSYSLKVRLIELSKFNLTRMNSLLFILAFTGIAVADSTIVSFSSFSGNELPTWLNVAVFLIFSASYVTMGTILLGFVRSPPRYIYNEVGSRSAKYFHIIATWTLILTTFFIGVIIVQMIVTNEYSVIFLKIQTYISHIFPLLFLSFLILLFYSWMASPKRNYVVVLFSIAFSLVCLNLLVSLAYLESYFSKAFVPYVKPDPLIAYVNNVLGGPFTESLSLSYDILSLTSFVVMWVATTVLLSQYHHRIGMPRYILLVTIPLIYYVLPSSDYFRDLFFSQLSTSPVAFNLMYLLIFSATQQVAALLFSLSFWTASSLVYDERVRKSLLISSIGMAILFGSIELTPLQFRVFPPFGLITESFIPLGAYLLFVGIYGSAKHISQDAKLRRIFYNSVESQLGLLKTIGVSEMEKEFEKKVKYLERHSSTVEEPYFPELEEQNIQKIINDVLSELHDKKDKKNADRPQS